MLRNGDYVGLYQIVGHVGRGGMATVYQAYHEKLDRHVAIKILHDTLLQEAGFLARFEREARIIARLDHPNIVPVYDYAEHEGKPYLVMKYVQGSTLEKILKEKALPLSEIVRIMDAVADALTYAHEMGILHRDIKPSNILIDERNIPYLTDFGLARLVRRGASTMSQGSIIGTPHYISPEQALGQRELDARTDVYSMGVVLYELVVGSVPFTGETPFAIVHDHIYAELPNPSEVNPEVPEEVSQVLRMALGKSPEERYDTPNALMADFRQAVEMAGLIELSPDRSIVAAQSLQLAQQQKAEQLDTPPSQQSVAPAAVEPAPPVPPPPPLPAAEPLGPVTGVPAPAPPPRYEEDVQLSKVLEQLRAGEPVDWDRVGEEMGERLGRWGERMGPRMEEWASRIGEKIEAGMDEGSSAEQRGLKKRGSSVTL